MNIIKDIKEKLDASGIENIIVDSKKSNFEKDSIRLLTMHSIKGLEFKVVFIIGVNSNIIPYLSYEDLNEESLQESMDRKLLYVGLTRANEFLYITTSGSPSKFL